MNQKLTAFFENAKRQAREAELQERNRHLIELGLTDDAKTEREYINYSTLDSKYDEEKKAYYIERPVALDISDEDYAEICKYNHVEESVSSVNNNAEKTLSIIARVTLWLGIIASDLLFIVGMYFLLTDEGSTGTSLLLLIVYILPPTILSWGLLSVVSNISTTLKQINSKLK